MSPEPGSCPGAVGARWGGAPGAGPAGGGGCWDGGGCCSGGGWWGGGAAAGGGGAGGGACCGGACWGCGAAAGGGACCGAGGGGCCGGGACCGGGVGAPGCTWPGVPEYKPPPPTVPRAAAPASANVTPSSCIARQPPYATATAEMNARYAQIWVPICRLTELPPKEA
ncbi:MAG: hypothetical protein E6G56_11780 [Actinobacteria bacterium]|nr:MAG: hypothetical protein E6G56_11780 [Actinomycetota bacterium]